MKRKYKSGEWYWCRVNRGWTPGLCDVMKSGEVLFVLGDYGWCALGDAAVGPHIPKPRKRK